MLLVWRGVGCGGSRRFPRTSAVVQGVMGGTMEDRWLAKNDEKQLKSSRADNSGVPGLYPAKTGTMRFRPTLGLLGCVFYLISVLPVFVPKRTRYLFLAAALCIFLVIFGHFGHPITLS